MRKIGVCRFRRADDSAYHPRRQREHFPSVVLVEHGAKQVDKLLVDDLPLRSHAGRIEKRRGKRGAHKIQPKPLRRLTGRRTGHPAIQQIRQRLVADIGYR